MTSKPVLLDMTPTGHYADHSPCYRFHTSFPTRGVRVLPEGWDQAAIAYAVGRSTLHEYLARDPAGNMGELLGVTKREDGFHAVINLYHSHS